MPIYKSPFCDLPDVPGSSVRQFYKGMMCNPDVLTEAETASPPYTQMQHRFNKIEKVLCGDPDTVIEGMPAYNFLDINKSRCINSTDEFYDGFKKYLTALDLKSWPTSKLQTIFDRKIIPAIFDKGDEVATLRTNAEPFVIPFQMPLNNDKQTEIKNIVLNEIYSGKNPIFKKTLGSKRNLPRNLNEFIAGDQSGPFTSQSFRLNNVVPFVYNEKKMVAKRLARFVTQPPSEINYLGVSDNGKPYPNLENPQSLVDANSDHFEFKEIITCLLFTYYLNEMYGNSISTGFISPAIYAVIIVPKYNIPEFTDMKGKKHADLVVKSEIIVISEAFDKTFEDWIQTPRPDEELKHFIYSVNYLDYCLNYNEIAPAFVQKYKQFLYTRRNIPINGDSYLPLYILYNDCKPDNIMITKEKIWKIIDADGLQLTYDHMDERPANIQYGERLISCTTPKAYMYVKPTDAEKANYARIKEIIHSEPSLLPDLSPQRHSLFKSFISTQEASNLTEQPPAHAPANHNNNNFGLNPDSIARIMSMGISRINAITALLEKGGDVPAAINYLFEGGKRTKNQRRTKRKQTRRHRSRKFRKN